MQLKYICKICGKECKNVISLTSHIQYNHKEYNTQKYYDKFYKKEDEGFCKVCGKPTKFKGVLGGYLNFCNKSCSHKTEHFRTAFRESMSNKTENELQDKKQKALNTIKSKSSTGRCITDEVALKRKNKSIDTLTMIVEKCDCTFLDYEMYNNIKVSRVKFRCNKCNREFVRVRSLLDRKNREQDYHLCPICNYPNTMVSKPERELADFISSIYLGNILRNDRYLLNGYELDIVLPEKKIAFEFDGIFWHMDSRKYKPTDINIRLGLTAQEIWDFDEYKVQLCREKGYRLYRVKELDWSETKDTVKQQIKQIIC